MGQDNVLQLLKRKKKWMKSKEIAASIKISPGNANVSLNKLFKQGLVLKKTLSPNKGLFQGAGYYPYYWRIK